MRTHHPTAAAIVGLITLFVWAPAAEAIIIVETRVAIDTSVGVLNPLSLVGFNPQPEPPLVDLSNPLHPRFMWSNSDNHYEILFGVEHAADIVRFDTPQSIPDGAGNYAFSFALEGAYPGGSEFFDVFFDIFTVGTFDRLSWVGFNPQPDPPEPHVAFEFDVTPNSPTSVDLGIQIVNRSTGDVGSFVIVPEPATCLLIVLGLACTVGRRFAGKS